MTVASVLATLALVIWIYLLVGRGTFWLARERDGGEQPLASWPSVTAIVPARDEAEAIARSIGSLLAQDYPGAFRIVLVDDQSADGTAEIARALDATGRLSVLSGAPLPEGWTGKLWAVRQGIAHATGGSPDYLWLTDADIVHATGNLRALVSRAESHGLVLVSLMAKLRCEDFAERFLIPPFVFFFAMLYPFAWVNRKENPLAAAAGGCMLVKREALEQAGGIESVRHEIIDDCALARRMKKIGAIWLGLTERTISVRRYPRVSDIGRMVSRSAYAELLYSPIRLLGAIAGMALVFAAPAVIALLPTDLVGWEAGLIAATAWMAMIGAMQPMLFFYRRSAFWGFALPLAGAIYAAFTLNSAIQYWRGRGGLWKGRVQVLTRAS
jgi:hopene-associated glycosyltransferase HpnB